MYRSEYGPISEPQHIRRQGDRILLDASRFAGVGTFEGELRVDGDTIAVTPDRYTATRDRSWGIRPVGEPEPAGRPNDFTGMWWCWIPLRFDDFALHVILEEDRDGLRNTNFAVRVFPEGSGRAPEQLGWPLPEIRYASGTRNPIGASIELTNREGKKSTLEIEPLIGISLNVGCGYGADPDWTHGLWKGDGWVEGSVVRLQRSRGHRPRRVLALGPRGPCHVRRPRGLRHLRARRASAPTPRPASPTSRPSRSSPARAATQS